MNGWLIIDKPEGISSFSVVSLVRKLLKIKRVGHAGTLDPLASGILAIAIGEATKTVPYVINDDKEYEFIIRWGQQTTTDDAEGEVLYSSDNRPSMEDIEKNILNFIGNIDQTPPIYSAIKINGQKAYKKARSGEDFTIKSRKVSIFDLKHIKKIDEDRDSFLVKCSKGTYVRSLARDLGDKLSCFGHALNIRRVKSGNFLINNTISLEKLKELVHKNKLQEYIISISDVLDDIPAVRLGSAQEKLLRFGQPIDGSLLGEQEVCQAVLCLSDNDRPIGLCSYQNQTLKPFRLFNI